MGGKTSTTTQGVSIPKEVMDRYNAINTRAENAAATPFQEYSQDPSAFVAQINQQQQQGINSVNANAGAYKPYFDQAASNVAAGIKAAQPGQLDTERYMNPFQQQVIDATMKQMGQANQQAQSGALGTAVSSGAFGGDRAGIAAANLANQQGMAMGSTLAGLNAQNYNQALQTAQQQQGVNLNALMQGGQFYAGLGQAAQQAGLQGAEAQINAGTLGQQTEQAGKSALYNQFQQKQAFPFQIAQLLANIGMGTGALSGSTTTTTQPGSFFSDRRLKEDVERIGEGDNGLPIYKYRYKGEPDTHIGFMADEVEQVHPEAVGLHPTGYKTVDYDRATKAEGGVAGPYGSPVGSQPGVSGYVPPAYLPVGELMMADPSSLDHARQSLAQQLEAVANMSKNVRELDATWDWAQDKWGSDPKKDIVKGGQAPTTQWRGGVAGGYADGGAAYLNNGLRGDQNPVDERNYLSDIVSSQEDAKSRDGLQSPGSVPQARTTGQDAADLAKVAMMFMGMNRGGRTGYATRGGVDDRTTGETIADAFAPLRNVITNRIPNTALAVGSLGTAGVQGLAGLGLGAVNQPGASQYMLDAAKNSVYRGMAFDRAANAPMPRDLSFGEISSLGQTPEQRAEIARRSSMTMVPPRYVGDTGNPLLPDPPAGLRRDTEYGSMLRDPSTAMAPIMLPSPSGGGGDRAPTSVERQARRQSDAAFRQRALGNEPPLSMYQKYVSPDDAPIPMPSGRLAEVQRGLKLLGNEPPSSMYQEGMPQRPLSDSLGLGGGGADRMPSPLTYGLKPVAMVSSGVPLSYSPVASSGPKPLSYSLRPMITGGSGVPLSYSPTGVAPAATLSSTSAPAAPTPADTIATPTVAGGVKGPEAPAMVTAPQQITPAPEGASSNPFGYAVGFTLQHEGGFNARDANGAPVNMGINQAYHPEVDVTKLTEAQAREIYRRDYWMPINGDKIAADYGPDMARAVFDTAVMSGPDTALDLFRKSGGDQQAFLQLRADYLNGLAQDNPAKYGKYVEAWNNRNLALGGPNMMTGFGEAGIGAPADRRSGLAAGLGNDKAYEDRNMLGKMMYDPDTGKLSRNGLLSLASGIGAMLSSPSQYFLPSLGLGMQGFAGTYAGLEKQAADIAQTQAETRVQNVSADKGRIFEGQNGMLLINFGDGRPPVELWDYMDNPAAYATGNPQLDAQIMREAQEKASAGRPTTGIFAAPEVQTLLDREVTNARRNPNDAANQSAAIENAVNASASIARSSIPSILTQADAVAALTSPDAKVRAGGFGPLKQTVANYLNDLSQTVGQITGVAMPTITDPNGGDAAANAQIILKEAINAGMISATGVQELQEIMAAQPNVALSAEANSALMAGLLVSGRTDMRRADFMRDYKAQPGNQYRTVIDAGQAFQEAYGNQILAEKAALKELIHYGSTPMPPEWAAALGDYKTPMEFLMTPGISPEDKSAFIAKLLPALGVNPMVISALNGPDGMYIGNYFGG